MSRDDIIRMAREAGGCEYGNANPEIESTFILKDDQIKAFADLVAAAEREACAKVCESRATPNTGSVAILNGAADAIRHKAAAELRRLHHNNLVLTNALWKACGDDREVVNATIESQGELE